MGISASTGEGRLAKMTLRRTAIRVAILTVALGAWTPAAALPEPVGGETVVWRTYANLHRADGRPLAVAATFSRLALDPGNAATRGGDTTWSAPSWYTATLMTIDRLGKRSESAIRTERPAFRAPEERSGEPLSIAVGGWSIRAMRSPRAPQQFLMHFADGATTIDLVATARTAPVVLEAPRDIAWTRLETHGTLIVEGRRIAVAGSGWFDRESSPHAWNVEGWDRFSVQFDDGRELLVRSFRGDGATAFRSGGVVVERNGTTRALTSDDLALSNPLGTRWKSERTTTIYPALWELYVVPLDLDLAVIEPFHDQEVDGGAFGHAFVDAAIDVERASPPGGQTGTGFVELTGYDWPLRAPHSH